MVLRVISSGSSGNCYVLENGSEALILEAGIQFRKVLREIDFNIGIVKGVLVTHRHGDHAGHLKSFVKNGLHVFSNKDVLSYVSTYLIPGKATSLEAGETYHIGNFTVKPFPVVHDVETQGFYIIHKDFGSLVFLTDTFTSEYLFPEVNYWVIEANYDAEMMEHNIESGRLHPSVRARVERSHFEVNNLAKYLKMNDLSRSIEVILIHLSGNNSDPEKFKSIIGRATGLPVTIAKPGVSVMLDKKTF